MSASDRYGADIGKEPDRLEAEIARTRTDMNETLGEIQHRFAPGEILDDVVEYVRSGPVGEFTANLGAAVRNNPVPIALVGAGLAWLMVARNQGDRAHSAGRSRSTGRRRYAAGASYGPAYDTSRDPSEAGAEGGAMERARERASAAAGRACDTADEALGRARETAQNAGDRIRETAGRARARMQSLGSGIGDTADQVRDMAYGQARRAGSGLDYLVHEQPLALAGIGFAIGAVLGAALPGTRREDAWMGEARDEMLQRAGAAGKETLSGAVEVAEASVEAAKAEADRQGLNVEGGKEQARQLKDKAGKVAAAARDAAQEEAEKEGLAPKRDTKKSP